MAKHRSEAGDQARLKAPEDHDRPHRRRPLARIQNNCQERQGFVPGAEDIGGANIAAANLSDVSKARHSGDHQTERDRTE